ncbi:uncharacterized protein [Typha angustifolia]|uniref:uncharacterized protein n=1 Tax=Typha angustifolia TaxID=59011 RepID=UPI003C2AE2E4
MAAPRTKECARLKEKCITAPSTPRSHHHHHRGRPPSPRMSIPGSPGRKFSEKPVASFRRPTVSSSLHTNSPPDKPHYPPFITGLAKHPPPRKPPEKFSSLTHPHPRNTYSTPVGIFDERPPRTPSSFAKFCSGKASSSVRSGRTQTLSSEWSGGLKRKRKDGNGSLPRISSVPEMVVQEEEEPPREIEMEESETVSIASIEEHLLPEELPDPDPDPIEPKDLDVIVDSSPPPPPPQTDGHLAPIIEQCEPSSSEEVAEIIHEDFQGVEEPEEAGDDGEKLEDEIEKTIVVESSTLSAELQKKSVFFEEEEEETEDKPKEVLEESSILSAEEAIQKQEEEEAKEMSVMMEASTSHAAEPEKEETVLQKEEELPDKAKAEKEAATVAAAAKKSEKEETVLQKEEELPDKAKAEEEAATAAAAAKKPESGVQGRKKKDAAKSNDVIEETKTKLMEKRKSKVLALVGAFETVMHLHEPDA